MAGGEVREVMGPDQVKSCGPQVRTSSLSEMGAVRVCFVLSTFIWYFLNLYKRRNSITSPHRLQLPTQGQSLESSQVPTPLSLDFFEDNSRHYILYLTHQPFREHLRVKILF